MVWSWLYFSTIVLTASLSIPRLKINGVNIAVWLLLETDWKVERIGCFFCFLFFLDSWTAETFSKKLCFCLRHIFAGSKEAKAILIYLFIYFCQSEWHNFNPDHFQMWFKIRCGSFYSFIYFWGDATSVWTDRSHASNSSLFHPCTLNILSLNTLFFLSSRKWPRKYRVKFNST